jgi:CRISPR type III-B/RAMP module RAMP protein Cmr6
MPDWHPVGPLAAVDRNRLPAPDHPRCQTANALLMLHRSAVLAVGEQPGTVKVDDDWMRSWARATRLGQGPAGDDSGLPAQVRNRRRAALASLATGGGTAVRTVALEPMTALVTGTGAGGIRDVGIELHGTYGWPVLPGSTLKGVAHAYARDSELPVPDEAAIFGAPPGDDASARTGAVTFLDALPGPGGIGVAEHVLTPHTRGYRLDPDDDNEDDAVPPAEYINPVPVPFLVLSGGTFLVHLIGPEPEVDRAADLLKQAVRDIGLGAKTTSGYGYLTVQDSQP